MAVVPDVSAILGLALDDEDAEFAESVIAAIGMASSSVLVMLNASRLLRAGTPGPHATLEG
jgi:cation transport ATPase